MILKFSAGDATKVMVLNRLYGGGSTHQGMSVRDAHSSEAERSERGRDASEKSHVGSIMAQWRSD